MRRRVVVTGAGVVSSLGAGVESFWDALAEGRSGASRVNVDGIGEMTAFPVADETEDARERFGQKEARRMDRAGRFASVAAALAMEDAGLTDVDHERIGGVDRERARGPGDPARGAPGAGRARRRPGEPAGDPALPSNAPCAAAARSLGLRGPSAAPATACAAGSDAIGTALLLLRDGRADAMVAGGAEAPISPMVVAGYLRVGALTKSDRPAREACRPFDLARDGFVIGEGAGVLMLEEREHALARGARIYAELAGYGSTCDANHLTDPDPLGEGPSRAMLLAMADAGIGPEDIGYVNAHATSTPSGDLAESRALAHGGPRRGGRVVHQGGARARPGRGRGPRGRGPR